MWNVRQLAAANVRREVCLRHEPADPGGAAPFNGAAAVLLRRGLAIAGHGRSDAAVVLRSRLVDMPAHAGARAVRVCQGPTGTMGCRGDVKGVIGPRRAGAARRVVAGRAEPVGEAGGIGRRKHFCAVGGPRPAGFRIRRRRNGGAVGAIRRAGEFGSLRIHRREAGFRAGGGPWG